MSEVAAQITGISTVYSIVLFSHRSRKGHHLNQWWLVFYRRIYASLRQPMCVFKVISMAPTQSYGFICTSSCSPPMVTCIPQRQCHPEWYERYAQASKTQLSTTKLERLLRGDIPYILLICRRYWLLVPVNNLVERTARYGCFLWINYHSILRALSRYIRPQPLTGTVFTHSTSYLLIPPEADL